MDVYQQVAYTVRQKHGYELTPEQARNEFDAAIENIREGMAARGHELSREQVMQLLYEKKKEDEALERCNKKIDDWIESLPKINKPWCVVGLDGNWVSRFEKAHDAYQDCMSRNCRARKWGISAKYDLLHDPTTPDT